MDKFTKVLTLANLDAGKHRELWDTRFGKSERIVVRNLDGTFINNVSRKQLEGK